MNAKLLKSGRYQTSYLLLPRSGTSTARPKGRTHCQRLMTFDFRAAVLDILTTLVPINFNTITLRRGNYYFVLIPTCKEKKHSADSDKKLKFLL